VVIVISGKRNFVVSNDRSAIGNSIKQRILNNDMATPSIQLYKCIELIYEIDESAVLL
jgi:uncharacterized UPF0146 family protein